MKTRLLMVTILILFNINSFAQGTIWNGPMTIFTKANGADWTQAANQDRITPNVWITRADTEGIFNIKQEIGYDKLTNTAPEDTEWAVGTTSSIGSLTFSTWKTAVGGNPSFNIGTDMVVHLITDDIYIDIKFLTWSQGAFAGGGFSYQRSTEPVFSINEFLVKGFKISQNPSDLQIKLILPELITTAAVKVFDILGKEVYSGAEYKSPINVSNWQKGIYLVQVTNSESTQTKKFVKN